MEDLKYWLWISKINKLGSINTQKLLKKYDNPIEIYNAKRDELIKIVGEKITEEILNIKYRKNLDEEIEYLNRNSIELVSIKDSRYPNKLKQIYDMPICLYVKGNVEILNSFSIAIIGCRNNTKYGELMAKSISEGLAQNNVVTVSGLAIGIDSIAHKSTVEKNGKTIAVIGSGLDELYPKENIELAKKIVQSGGAIVTEYPMGTKAERMNFPARNRIISGISDGVVVVEAKNKSGTMITVDFALEHGREVFCVPGNVTSKNSEGTNELIKDGAKLVTRVEDIMQEFNGSNFFKC